jgi:hypothetical protein
MTIDRLRQMHQARPFRPFDIHLADGRSIPVEHPEFLSQSAGGRTLAVAVPGTDAIEVVDLLLVTSLKQRDSSQPRRGRSAR